MTSSRQRTRTTSCEVLQVLYVLHTIDEELILEHMRRRHIQLHGIGHTDPSADVVWTIMFPYGNKLDVQNAVIGLRQVKGVQLCSMTEKIGRIQRGMDYSIMVLHFPHLPDQKQFLKVNFTVVFGSQKREHAKPHEHLLSLLVPTVQVEEITRTFSSARVIHAEQVHWIQEPGEV